MCNFLPKFRKIFSLIFSVCLLGYSSFALSDESATSLIYQAQHFQNVKPNEFLTYEFGTWNQLEKIFTEPPNLTESVNLEVLKVEADSLADVLLSFPAQGHQIEFPVFHDLQWNPVITAFLEHDIQELSEKIGGGELYFRNSIRHSLNSITASHEIISYVSENVPAKMIEIQPFSNSPLPDHLKPIVEDKVYRFWFSEKVPGFVAQIETQVTVEPNQASNDLSNFTFGKMLRFKQVGVNSLDR